MIRFPLVLALMLTPLRLLATLSLLLRLLGPDPALVGEALVRSSMGNFELAPVDAVIVLLLLFRGELPAGGAERNSL